MYIYILLHPIAMPPTIKVKHNFIKPITIKACCAFSNKSGFLRMGDYKTRIGPQGLRYHASDISLTQAGSYMSLPPRRTD